MRKNTWAGWALFVSAGLVACGSSNDVTTGQQGAVDGSAASSGSNGTSGSSGTSGNANAGGSGQAGSGTSGSSGTGQAGSGTSGNPNAGGSGQAGSGTSGSSGTGQAGSSGNPNAGGTGQAGAAGAGTGATGSIIDGGNVTWGSTQCTDGIDNDGDGKVDGADPECTGPLDNDESTYATGIPGDNQDPKWQDCFFDGNSGAGDDGCRYNTGCLTGTIPQTDKDCALTQQCKDYCLRYTPNGCDCFGCCKVPLAGGGTTSIQITATCTLADAGDPTKCPPCVQATQCNNTCGTCELCIGKDTLPPSCTPPPPATGGAPNGGTSGAGGASAGGANPGGAGGASAGGTSAGGAPSTGGAPICPTPSCPVGQAPCGVSCLPACGGSDFCLTGCCVHPPA